MILGRPVVWSTQYHPIKEFGLLSFWPFVLFSVPRFEYYRVHELWNCDFTGCCCFCCAGAKVGVVGTCR